MMIASACVSAFCKDQDYIVVHKKNVVHRFVSYDDHTDCFVKFWFPVWEDEMFEVFEQVKDSQGIAIDLGAWIGATTIWLSKNFNHVIAVDADKISVQCLENNLKASACPNVSICSKAISNIGQEVIFGARAGFKGDMLNQSVSYIKNSADSGQPVGNDYIVQTITFDALMQEYILKNDHLKDRKVSFIKCDIEGGEEGILEDLLSFAFQGKCKVYMSFHLPWWKSKKITDFASLFKKFKTNCSEENVCQYLEQHPFGSVLFEPREEMEQTSKKFILLTVLYNETNPQRLQEYKTCMERNLQHPLIEGIHVLYDLSKDGGQGIRGESLLDYLKTLPITITYIDDRPAFGYCFDLVNTLYPDRKIILSNADIYFNDTLQLLMHYDLTNKFIVLTRWNVQTDGSVKIFAQNDGQGNFDAKMSALSHDVWIFNTPLKQFPNTNIKMGTWACDGYIAYQAYLAELDVINPCLSVQCCHLHRSGVRHWIPQSTPGLKALVVPWCQL